MKTRSNEIVRVLVGTAIILAIPLVAMQFSDEVKWGLLDFIVIGTLLIGSGLIYELIARRLGSAKQRAILGAAVVAVVIAIWVELAVGIFD